MVRRCPGVSRSRRGSSTTPIESVSGQLVVQRARDASWMSGATKVESSSAALRKCSDAASHHTFQPGHELAVCRKARRRNQVGIDRAPPQQRLTSGLSRLRSAPATPRGRPWPFERCADRVEGPEDPAAGDVHDARQEQHAVAGEIVAPPDHLFGAGLPGRALGSIGRPEPPLPVRTPPPARSRRERRFHQHPG